jgi:carboxypeptidase C (cathepsin A)
MKRWIVIAAVLGVASSAPLAQQPTDKPADKAAEKAADLPPLPADAHVAQSIQLAGKTLNYTATVGTIPVYGADNKKTVRSSSPRTRWTARTVRSRSR